MATNSDIAPKVTSTFSKDVKKSWVIIVCAALFAFALYAIMPYEPNVKKGLALLVFAAVLWFTEAIHITITALLIPAVAVIIGIHKIVDKKFDLINGALVNTDSLESVKLTALTIKDGLANFSNPTIYLFFGGFALATALHIQKLDRKIAMKLISLSGNHLGYAVFSICVVTALLSMWISNTATAAMMLPLAIGILSQLDLGKDRSTFVFVLLSIAYSASIGGLGTMVGSPPNAIASAALKLDFIGWMKIGLPIMLILFPLMLITLYITFRPKLNMKINLNLEEDVPWTGPRIATLIVFLLTAFLWIFSKKISAIIGVTLSDALIALMAACAVAILGLASWKDIAKGTDWGVLLLFGGGLALSGILQGSGASLVLGKEVARIFGNTPQLVIIAVVTIFIIILTEFTSNTASAALLVPVFATIATEMGMPKETLVMVIGIGASCAFMLPVATPPNAIVFGTGYIRQKDMMKAGFFLGLVCVAVITLYAHFILG